MIKLGHTRWARCGASKPFPGSPPFASWRWSSWPSSASCQVRLKSTMLPESNFQYVSSVKQMMGCFCRLFAAVAATVKIQKSVDNFCVIYSGLCQCQSVSLLECHDQNTSWNYIAALTTVWCWQEMNWRLSWTWTRTPYEIWYEELSEHDLVCLKCHICNCNVCIHARQG